MKSCNISLFKTNKSTQSLTPILSLPAYPRNLKIAQAIIQVFAVYNIMVGGSGLEPPASTMST